MERMKTILLRLTALVLVLAMTVGLVPPVSAAPEDEAVSSMELGGQYFEGKTPVGDLIAGELTEELALDAGETGEYNVMSLEITGSTALVDIDLLEDAHLVVALYTEDGMQLLNSASMDVTADMTEATVTFEGEMPEYFLARAYLLDGYDYSPLCTPYETIRYTRDVQELIASDIHDYDPELVVNLDEQEDTNFAVYHESTIRIAEKVGVNLVTTLDYENKLFVIEKADEQFTSLSEGNIIAYVYDGGMLLAKVAQIAVDGTTVTIHGGDLALKDVFSHMKLENGAAPSGADAIMPQGGALEGNESITVPMEDSFKEKEFLNGKVELSLKVEGSVTASIDFYLIWDKQSVDFKIELEADIGFEVEVEGKAGRFKIPLSLIPIPLIPSVVDGVITPALQVEFAASLTGTASVTAVAGVAINHEGKSLPKVKNLCSKPKFETGIKIEGTVFIGLDLQTAIVIGSGAGEVSLNFKCGLELVGVLAEVKLGDGIHHDCDGLCITGEANVLFSAYTKARLIAEPVEKTLVEKRLRLKGMDFYVCAKHSDIGKGECPHMLRKITITVKDENGEPVSGVTVESDEAKVLIPADDITNDKGVAILYLPEGKHKITVDTFDKTGKKTVKVGEDPKKATIKLKLKETEEEEEEDDEEDGDAIGDSDQIGFIDNGPPVATGDCGTGVTWELFSNGLLLFSGMGEIPEDDYNPEPWDYYVSKVRTVVIEKGVTSIPRTAFYYYDNLTSVVIGDSVTSIGEKAFADCYKLSSVSIGESVTSIGIAAFEDCSMTSVIIPDSVTYIGNSAFFNCDDLTRVTLGDGVSTIGGFAFSSCDNLTRVTMGDNVTTIGAYAFSECTSLTRATIPDSVTSMGSGVFNDCENLKSVTLGSGITAISDLTFYGCDSLTSVNIPDGVTSIGYQAFLGCDSLTSVDIPDSVTTIDYEAFGWCALTRVTIPASVTSIGYGPFYACWRLEEILVDPDNGYYVNDAQGVLFNKDKTELLQAPCKLAGVYTIPDTVTSIGEEAFAHCSHLTGVNIPDSVTSISEKSFRSSGLKSVTIPDSVTSIGVNAFAYCYMDSVTIPDSVTTIGDFAFYDCDKMTSVTIGSGVTSIGKYAFSDCDSLTSVVFTGDAPEFGYGTFEENTSTVYYPATNPTWTAELMDSFWPGAELTWVPYIPGEALPGATASAVPLRLPGNAQKPEVGLDGIFRGEYDTGEQDGVAVRTAKFDGLVPGAEYVLLVLASLDNEDRLASDNLLFIGHTTSAEDGTAAFVYIPRTPVEHPAVILCGPSSRDLKDAVITFPEMSVYKEHNVVEPTVLYNGVPLIEGEDYELTGSVSYWEPGTYTLLVHGIHDYTGVVECTYTVGVHDHIFEEYTSDGNATCLEDGTKTGECTICGEAQVFPDPGSALGHDWDEGVVTLEPTPATEGEKLHTCIRCGETKTEVVPKQEHEHEYEVVFEWPGSCQSFPFTVYECKLCGENYQVEGTERLPHEWDAGVVTVEPTEETEGERLFSCIRCSATKTEPEPRIHDCTYAFSELVEPTCYDRGYSIYVCTYCGKTTEDDFVDALGHDWGIVLSVVDPTCYNSGYTVYGCTRCQATHRSDYVNPIDHIWDEGVITIEPTYETPGEILYTCTLCGWTKRAELPNLHDHSYYVYEVVEPTCMSEGYTVYRCMYCEEHYQDDFTATVDHSWDEGVVILEPTVETEGEMLYTCIWCSETCTESIPKLHAHSYVVIRVIAPTCTGEGYTIYLCSGCGEVVFDDYTAALGHSFGAWTDAGNGKEKRSCERCGVTEERTAGGPVNPFTDVPEGSFYYDPVLWAVERGITNGTTPTTFGPNDQCMRAHVVTFLWRAAGSPEPKKTDNPFVDVKPSDFYYKAVLWAVEKGVTNGVDATHFGPTVYCNRAQVVTFLYRSLGSPAVANQSNPFTDVPAGQWFTAPVLWAVEKGVTNGLTATQFGPNAICNRAQIVTFLYRAFAE